MKVANGSEIAALASGIISEKHQVKSYGVDLTVSGIRVVKKEGDIDFGGSEEKAAITEKLESEKRNDGDEYGWWELAAGEYLVEYNEKVKIPEGRMGIIQPLPRALTAGVTHTTMILPPGDEVGSMVLLVGKFGFNIKENARLSSLLMLKAIEA